MKAQSSLRPKKTQDLGDGRGHFNYNIEEKQDEFGDVIFEFDQVVFRMPEKRGNIISALIAEKYSIDEEISILRQKEIKPEKFQEYFNYCETCKSMLDE